MRCPLVPPATGKLSIWVAKTKVATSPASGAMRSSTSRRAPRNAIAMPAAATPAVASEVGASRNPSGTCIAKASRSLLHTVCNNLCSAPGRLGWGLGGTFL